ncbi:sodium-coupled monocarboxylate transporter 2-like [Dermacentor variabilis]|uniref:sodium-coupled monocarboxylate transporter 2-like n=1 Tax=Dermacentor variabilis TaxID=34621 RepID=UPI003F5B552C
MSIYRICLDQMVVQRLLASRTLKEAQRTICTGALLINVFYVAALLLGVAMTIWFRGCDPSLSGAISSTDQIMPYYVKTYLIHVPGFSGLFLSGVVSAATSTVSSIINSQAAILYVDVIVHRCQNAEKHVRWITRGTALALGISMTVYSMLCAHMGSLSRSFLMACNSLSAPFVGLCLIGVLFPFVRAKELSRRRIPRMASGNQEEGAMTAHCLHETRDSSTPGDAPDLNSHEAQVEQMPAI